MATRRSPGLHFCDNDVHFGIVFLYFIAYTKHKIRVSTGIDTLMHLFRDTLCSITVPRGTHTVEMAAKPHEKEQIQLQNAGGQSYHAQAPAGVRLSPPHLGLVFTVFYIRFSGHGASTG